MWLSAGFEPHIDDTSQSAIDEMSKLVILPRRFFFYGTIRDDAAGTKFAAGWTKDFASGCKGYTAKVYGFKMYQHLNQHFPFAIQTNWKHDYIIGRLMEFDDDIFASKLKQASFISSWTPNDPIKSFYTPIIVDVYVEEDDKFNENMKYGKIFKAITFYRKSDTIQPDYLKKCCPVPFNDWLQNDYFPDENEYNDGRSAYSAKKRKWMMRHTDYFFDENEEVTTATESAVGSWLSDELNLSQYVDNFIANGYDDMDVIPEILTENDLIEIGVDKKGHRRKIMLFIDKIKKQLKPADCRPEEIIKENGNVGQIEKVVKKKRNVDKNNKSRNVGPPMKKQRQ